MAGYVGDDNDLCTYSTELYSSIHSEMTIAVKCKERHLICGPNNLIHRGQRSVCMVSLDLQELQQSAQPLSVS